MRRKKRIKYFLSWRKNYLKTKKEQNKNIKRINTFNGNCEMFLFCLSNKKYFSVCGYVENSTFFFIDNVDNKEIVALYYPYKNKCYRVDGKALSSTLCIKENNKKYHYKGYKVQLIDDLVEVDVIKIGNNFYRKKDL